MPTLVRSGVWKLGADHEVGGPGDAGASAAVTAIEVDDGGRRRGDRRGEGLVECLKNVELCHLGNSFSKSS